jgi:cytochrome c
MNPTMILAVTIALFMGIIITVAVLTAFIVDVNMDVEKEQQPDQPDLVNEILNEIRQRIIRYGQDIASETNEKARFIMIMKQDALSDLYQDLELFVMTKKQKEK